MTMQPRVRDRGFTMIEMLVALVIVAVVMLGVFNVFTSTKNSYNAGTENIDGQQNARAALTWLSKELRSAKGFNLIGGNQVTILSDKTTLNQQRTFRLDTGDQDGDGRTDELLLIRNPDDDGTPGVYTDEIAVGVDSLAFIYRNAAGNPTTSRASVQEVEVLIFASGHAMRDDRVESDHSARQVGMSTRVKCRNLGMSVPSLGDVTAPAPPTGISVVMGCGTATVNWSANSETDMAGYFLSYSQGSSGSPYSGTDADQGSAPIFVGNVTSYTLTGLAQGSTYYFNLQAVDKADNTSMYGSEVSGVPVDAIAPSTPTGVAGRVVGNSDIQINWNAVPDWDVDWYVVSWYDNANPSAVQSDSTQATSLTVSGLAQDAIFTFTVTARDGCGNVSAASSPFTITMVACSNDVTFPAEPANPAVVPGDEFVKVTWSSVPDPDVVGYQVYFQEAGTTYGSTLLVGNVTAYSLYGLVNGRTYEMQVAAVDGCGNVGPYTPLLSASPQNCASNTTPPETPANLSAVDPGLGDRIKLSWTIAGQGDVLGYYVRWGTSPTSLSNRVDVGNSIFYTVNGLTSGTTYYFAVESYDVCGNVSSPSSPVSAIPTWGCLCPPTVSTSTPAPAALLTGTVTWAVSAAACSTSSLANVEFRVDGVTKYVDYSSPYEFGDFGSGWDTLFEPDGVHTLVAVATDAAGCQTADTLTVFVDNSMLGASCLGIPEGESADITGVYEESFAITVSNLSTIKPYDLTGMILEWDDPTLMLLTVSIDGSVVWYAASGIGAASGDSLTLAFPTTIMPSTDVVMSASMWDKTGNYPPVIDVAAMDVDVTFLGSPTPACGPYDIPMDSCLPDVSITSVNSSRPYDVWGEAHFGDTYYSDRTYTLVTVPNEIASSILVRQPNNDKNLGDSFSLVLDVDRDVTVWIAYDPRGTPPNWIGASYTNTGLSIGVTDTGTPTLNLWKKNYAAGSITLHGNKAQGWGGGVATNYVIFVTCQ